MLEEIIHQETVERIGKPNNLNNNAPFNAQVHQLKDQKNENESEEENNELDMNWDKLLNVLNETPLQDLNVQI